MKRVGSIVVRLLAVAAVTAMLSPVSMAFAAVNNDEVTSQKLKEADGTSGQNTNSGSGVKTGHIQNGAVTNAKIGGVVSVDKLATYNGMIVVHTGPADGLYTFNSINSAIASGQSNLIKLMPGTYSEEISVPSTQGVVIEGSTGTVINGSVLNGYSITLKDLTINGAVGMVGDVNLERVNVSGDVSAQNVTISNCNVYGVINGIHVGIKQTNVVGSISIANGYDSFIIDTRVNASDSSEYGIHIYQPTGYLPGIGTIRNVSVYGGITALKATGWASVRNSTLNGVSTGIFMNGTVDVTSSSATGGVTGIEMNTSSSIIRDSVVFGNTDGIIINPSNWGNTLVLLNSNVTGVSNAINQMGAVIGATYNIVNTQLSGIPMSGLSGEIKRVNCYDGLFNVLQNL